MVQEVTRSARESSDPAPRPSFSAEQRFAIFQAAVRRVTEAVRHEPPESTRHQLGAIAYTSVFGVFVTLKRAGKLRACCGHIELPVPLSQALDAAADRAATDDPRFPPIDPAELDDLDMDVWILWSPQMVREKGVDRVSAVTVGKHGLIIHQGFVQGLLLPGVAVEHHFDAQTFLREVCLKAGLPPDAWLSDDTQLETFEGSAIHGPFHAHLPDARPPAVAGTFYPETARAVHQTVDALFADLPKKTPEPWAGALIPHAGWVYSGRLAATTLARIAIPQTVILLAPKHRHGGAHWAIDPHHRWQFPGGELASDCELASRLAAGVENLVFDAASHREEHAIEVQLPLIAHQAPKTRIVGITVGHSILPELLEFGRAMAVVLRELAERPLILVSSDMNHFANESETQRLDRMAFEAIATLDPECIYETVQKNNISMCGMAACVVAMETLRRLDSLQRCELVGRTTSAETNGDKTRVVGYAGILFR